MTLSPSLKIFFALSFRPINPIRKYTWTQVQIWPRFFTLGAGVLSPGEELTLNNLPLLLEVTMTHFYWTNLEPIWRSLNSCTSSLNIKSTSSVESPLAAIYEIFENTPRKQLSSLPNYPHCDCWTDDKLNKLYLEFALAGYPQDNIKVSASKNQLRVKVDSVPPRGTGAATIHNGISRKDIDFSLSIDEAFKLSEATTSFEEGLLKIAIPRAEEAEVINLM